jgi:hypothetical protein
MKKFIAFITLIGAIGFAGDLDYTTAQVNSAISDAIVQLGAGGYSASTNMTSTNGVWVDVPSSFIIPYVSGFDYVSGSTVVYTNGTRTFCFLGSCSLTAQAQGSRLQVGLETNGVYVVGSSSGERTFATGTSGSMSYNFPLTLHEGDTVGLVLQSSADDTVTINTWQSTAIRY